MTKDRTADRSLTVFRLYDAPQQQVFDAWVEPEQLAQWSGPEGFTSKSDYFDATPGGAYRSCLIGPDGTEYWVSGVYKENQPPNRLVFTHAWEDAQGVRGPDTTVTITLSQKDGQTLLTLHQAFFETKQSRDGHAGGWASSLEALASFLATAN